jgi:xanthine dehydrogenase accessory factor
VVATHGSTPQRRGAKMLVLEAGNTLGTLGGGCVEAEVRKQSLELLAAGTSKLLSFSLDHDYGWDDGLICGGVMDIFVQVVSGDEAREFAAIATALGNEQPATFEFRYTSEGEEHRYAEDLGPPPVLVIAGAGHVGQALATLAGELEFRVDVIDDRPEFASKERFPRARRIIVGDIEQTLRDYSIDAETYVVVVTRGHKNDGRALAAVINSDAKYIGLIGSKRKVKGLFDELAAQGVERARLMRVHGPIGLDIGAVSVPEIAVSIAAEIVAVRRGRGDEPARPMKMDSEQLQKWLERKR